MERPSRKTSALRRRGAEIIEMGISMGVLMALVFGGVEFGYFFFVKHSLQTAAREGDRVAVLSGSTNSTVNTAIANAMSNAGLTNSGYTVTTIPANISAAASGTEITVTVSCTWGTVGAAFRPLALISSSKA